MKRASMNTSLPINLRQRKTLAHAIGSCFLMAATGAFAQSEAMMLEEVVVTAQKRSESLLDVPISISALGGEVLAQRSLRDLEDISTTTPGVNFENANEFGGPTIAIRGIRADVGSATTSFYLDEMPLLQRADDGTDQVTPHVFDLERVEILRGPQGTLYGAGSMGGSIRYITRQPSLNESSLSVGSELSYTDEGAESYEVSVVGGLPLIDDELGFRGGIFYRDEGGYVDRADRFTGEIIDKDVNEVTTYAIRGTLKWAVTDQLDITPTIQYQKGESKDRDLTWDQDPGFTTRTRGKQPENTTFTLANVKAEYEASRFTLTSVTSYMDRETDLIRDWTESDGEALGGVQRFLPDFKGRMYWDVNQKAYSQEFRFASIDDGSSKLSWLIGLYYQHNKLELVRNEYQDLDAVVLDFYGVPASDIPAGVSPAEFIFGAPLISGPLSDTLGPVSYYQNLINIEEEKALFLNVGYALTDELKINLGARVSKTEFDGTQIQDGTWAGSYSAIQGVQKDSPVTPRINVTYEPTEESMYYFTAAKGFRLGGSNQDFSGNALCAVDLGPEGNPLEFKSDELVSYELGTKNRLANGRAQLSASVYHIDWTDIQRPVQLPTCLNYYTDNLGEATVDGLDLEFEMQLTETLKTTVSAGYIKGEFSKTSEKFGKIYSLDGQEFNQPKVMGNATLFYNGNINNYDTYGNLSVTYTGSYTRGVPVGVEGAASTPDEIRHAESIVQASARAGVYLGEFDVSMFVENLTNTAPELGRTKIYGDSTTILERSIRPRTIGLAVKYDF